MGPSSPARIAGRTAATYLALTAAWIYCSDRFLEHLSSDPARLSLWQTYKGLLFVVASAALIYVLVVRALRAQAAAVEETTRARVDLERRKETEAKIRAANADLARQSLLLAAANKELEAFSFSVSHDLRAPLRAIDGFTRILLEEHAPQLDAEGRRLCGIIGDNTRRMGELIDALLALSRLGRVPLRFAEVDIASLAQAVFDEITTPAERARIDLRLAPMPKGCGDAALLRQVLANLLGNAVKFSAGRERAHIFLQGAAARDEIVYSVADNGAGFDMRYAGKLFGVFQRLHSAREFEGSGIGLAIVQRIIERHGGRVWAEGTPGAGAVFHFTLRRTEAEDALLAGG